MQFDSQQGARDISQATSIRALNPTPLPSQKATVLFPGGKTQSHLVERLGMSVGLSPLPLAYEGTAQYLLILFPSQMSSHHQEIQALRSEGFGRGNILFRVATC